MQRDPRLAFACPCRLLHSLGRAGKRREIIQYLLTLPIQPLARAVMRGDASKVRLFIQAGADVNHRGLDDRTPLHLVSVVDWL